MKDEPLAGFNSDRALTRTSEDRFGRSQFAERIASTIGTRTDPSSLVVGLYGPWGDGKTSTLNFIRQHLADFPLITCITFNPWRFDSEETLLEGFFTSLASALEAKLTTKAEIVGKAIKEYSAVLKLGPTGISEVASAAGMAMSNTSVETLRDRISKILSESRIRVVVLIDDIDRMEKTEIQAIFRLVKLTADFENTAYVLAFDEQMVAKAVGERYSSLPADTMEAGRNFLEKIVQVPLHLPAPKKGKIRLYCFQMLDRAMADLKITFPQGEINSFVSSFTRGLEWKVNTPRMAVRYINAVRFAAGILYGEVYLPDLLLIEGIRTFFPTLYDKIRKQPDLFLEASDEKRAYNEEDSLDKLIQQSIGEATPDSRRSVRRLLESLFPRCGRSNYGNDWNKAWAKEKRVASGEYFDRYFTYSIDETDVPDRVITSFLEELEKPETRKRKLADLITSDNASLFIGKLRKYEDSLEPAAASTLIRELAENGSIYPDPPAFMSFGQPYSQAAILVSRLFKQLQPAERLTFALDLVETSADLPFFCECLRWLSSSKEEGENNRILTEPEQNSLQTAVAKRVGEVALAVGPEWNFSSRYSTKLLYAWKWGLGDTGVKEFVASVLKADPPQVFPLLRSTLGLAWSVETGVPFEPRFERNAYDSITALVDAGFVASLIDQLVGDQPNLDPDDDEEVTATDVVLGKAFIRIHEYVQKEARTKGATQEDISVISIDGEDERPND